jgi:hypothetical protein
MSTTAETRADAERNLEELRGIRYVLLQDADDLGDAQSELTVVEGEIRQAEETLLELGEHDQEAAA